MGLARTAARHVLAPLRDRGFTHARYDSFLERLTEHPLDVVPLERFAGTDATSRAVLAIRHDVDVSLESALALAKLEHARGIQTTYFVLHTAPYWSEPGLLHALHRLQDEYDHEIGWHNDLVTLECVHGGDARSYLAQELDRLREAGIRISGSAAHGSGFCNRFGYHNNYFFTDFAGESFTDLQNRHFVTTPCGRRDIPKASLADYRLTYEAYHLDNDLYFSDTAPKWGRRWHPDNLNLSGLTRGHKAIALIHPCHWDKSLLAKTLRVSNIAAARARREREGW